MSFTITRKINSNASIDWIIPDMVLMNELNLLDGRGESGKSSVVSAIIGDWNNNQELKRDKQLKNVLWLSQEEDFDLIIRPRLLQYGLHEDQVVTIPYRNGDCPRPRLPANHTPIVELIKRHNINCIVVDPFTELKEHDWSINDGDQMRHYLSCFSRLCVETSTTMFAMRHMRKASGSYSADDGMGSAQIRDTARNILRVDKTEERERRYFLTVQKSNMAKPTMPLEFGFELTPHNFGKLKWMGHKELSIDEIKKLSESKVRRMKLDDAKLLLSEALKDGPKPANELIEEADNNGIGERTLADAKAEMDVWSHRTRDDSTNKMYFLWGLKDQPRPNKSKSSGDEMPQLTLQDLPEAQPPQAINLPDAVPPKPKRERKPKKPKESESGPGEQAIRKMPKGKGVSK